MYSLTQNRYNMKVPFTCTITEYTVVRYPRLSAENDLQIGNNLLNTYKVAIKPKITLVVVSISFYDILSPF